MVISILINHLYVFGRIVETLTELESILPEIHEGIAAGAYQNETEVRTKIVQRVLQALGWNVYDPNKVCDEYSLKLNNSTRRIDVALCVSNRNPRCIIELKGIKYDFKQIGQSVADQQLFEYAFHAGAPLALLTNGAHWRFYSAHSAGTYEERLIRALDIKLASPACVAFYLNRYLSYENLESGKAIDDAIKDRKERIDKEKAREAIPRAWAHLVKEELYGRLSALLTEAVERFCEVTPRKEDIAEFLFGLKPGVNPPPPSPLALAPRSWRQMPSQLKPSVNPPPPSPPPLRFWVLGKERSAKNAKEAYVSIFKTLAERDPRFLPRAAQKLRGHKNCYLARSKMEISSVERVARQSVLLPGDWWLSTWLSNKSKMRYLKIACEVANVKFGDRNGLEISFSTYSRSDAPTQPQPDPGRVPPPPPRGAVRFWVLGKERSAKNAKEAYVSIFKILAERNPEFLSRAEPRLRGHKNRHLARSQQEISANEGVARKSIFLPGGWWLNTVLSNKAKTQYLKIACEVANVKFGDQNGVEINLPNA